jgi:hypothetical protein
MDQTMMWKITYLLGEGKPVSFFVPASKALDAIAEGLSGIKALHPPQDLTDDVLDRMTGFIAEQSFPQLIVSGSVEIRSADRIE